MALYGKKILTVTFLFLVLLAHIADARELKVKRIVKKYQIEATIDRFPLVLGDNHIKIEIKDESGRRITDAKVLVNYYMPPMPRMVPMNYKTKASIENEIYKAKMDIIMAGPWYIKIIFKHKGEITSLKLNVDAQ